MRRKTKTYYQRAGSTPSSREKRPQSVPEGISEHVMSPLSRYLSENEGSGVSIPELVEQFRELDCEHRFIAVAGTATKTFLRCDGCGKTFTKEKLDA